MTQEDKELLLKDLSARLPYGVILRQYSCIKDYYHNSGETIDIPLNELIHPIFERGFLAIRPYLRPMSSMTEEEKVEYYNTMDKETQRNYPNSCDFSESVYYSNTIKTFDWLNVHHFDYRELIPKGLAIEVTEKNNPYKK